MFGDLQLMTVISIFGPFIVILVIYAVLYFVFSTDRLRKEKFVRKMFRNISNTIDNGEFEDIYDNLMSNENIDEVKKEQRENKLRALFSNVFVILAFVTMLSPVLILPLASKYKMDISYNDDFISSILLILVILFFVVGILLKKKTMSKYKTQIIKKLILAINPNMKYVEDKSCSSAYAELYLPSGFKDSNVNRENISDYMEYELDFGEKVKLGDMHLRYRSSGKNSSTVDVFEGLIARVTREKNINNNILIERNKILKSKNRVIDSNQEFEKYFDIYADDMDNVNIILTSSVKRELLELYKMYGIMFEISIKGKDIFVRFFTGNLFENKGMFSGDISKRILYKEYVIFKSILTIINKINAIF